MKNAPFPDCGKGAFWGVQIEEFGCVQKCSPWFRKEIPVRDLCSRQIVKEVQHNYPKFQLECSSQDTFWGGC